MKIITSIITENRTELNRFQDIQQYACNFFKELYYKTSCNIEKQNHFLSFITNGLSDEDRAMLAAPLTKEEIKKVLLDMA